MRQEGRIFLKSNTTSPKELEGARSGGSVSSFYTDRVDWLVMDFEFLGVKAIKLGKVFDDGGIVGINRLNDGVDFDSVRVGIVKTTFAVSPGDNVVAEERERKVKVVLDEVLVPGGPIISQQRVHDVQVFGLEFNEKAGQKQITVEIRKAFR